jgi:hypothetical protein
MSKVQQRVGRVLHPDAPPVPVGFRPLPGVQYGCGSPECDMCYEPIPEDMETDHAEG